MNIRHKKRIQYYRVERIWRRIRRFFFFSSIFTWLFLEPMLAAYSLSVAAKIGVLLLYLIGAWIEDNHGIICNHITKMLHYSCKFDKRD